MFSNLSKLLIVSVSILLLAACGREVIGEIFADIHDERESSASTPPPLPPAPPPPLPPAPPSPPAPLCPRPLEADEMGISNAAELAAIIPLDTVSYVLTADISLAHIPNWTPLVEFFGKLDGNCYKITDMTITINPSQNAGLFSSLNGATINNLALENVNINSARTAGSIAARAVGGTVSNSYSTGTVNTTGGAEAGGLFGYTDGTEINNSYSTATVSGESEFMLYIGGLVGEANNTAINSSYSTGSVTVAAITTDIVNAGGLVGRLSASSVNNSYSTATVRATGDFAYAGGIAGAVYSGSVQNSYSTGSVIVMPSGISPQVCGIVGNVFSATVSNNVAINSELTTSSLSVWRIADEGMSNNLAWDGIVGTFVNKGLNGRDGEDRTADQLRDQATYEALGWEFGDGKPWKMVGGRDYPALSWE